MKVKELAFKNFEGTTKPKGVSAYQYVVIKTKPMFSESGVKEVAPSRYHMPSRASDIAWDAKGIGAIEAYALVNKPNINVAWVR